MPKSLKIILWFLIMLGFIFGFAGLVFPDQSPLVEILPPGTYQFQRLHIFLFNLVSGGTVLLFFTQGRKKLSWLVGLFMLGSIIFSVGVFLNRYLLASFLAVGLALAVEVVRIQKFSFFPRDFFNSTVPVVRKFHQAAL